MHRRRYRGIDSRRRIVVAYLHHPYRFAGRVETVLRGGLCLCEGAAIITSVYIDGFNLYYRALKDTPLRWLNLRKLAEVLFPQDSINQVCYFTARLDPRLGNPNQPRRQLVYLRALATLPGFEAHYGIFRSGVKRRPQYPVYRCFLPDLAGFTGLRRVGPNLQRRRLEK